MRYLMCTLFLSAIFNLAAHSQGSQVDTTAERQWPSRPFQQHIITLGPVMTNNGLSGGILAYETGLGHDRFTLHLSVRSHAGIDSTVFGDITVPAHYRFELQPRFYPMVFAHQLFFAPLANFTTEGSLGGGFLMGYRALIAKRFTAEAFMGFQNSTTTEPYQTTFFLRAGLAIGIAIPALKPLNRD